ncbi:MAG: uracil-DNA glycosylase family protein, partial [Desulfosarcina sp.]
MIRRNDRLLAGLTAITDDLVARTRRLTFAAPVSHTYHPLVYARTGYDRYLNRFGRSVKPVVLVGMNPGPFGMTQTGVPFGDAAMVMDWMGIEVPVLQPEKPHPKRPVWGFSCARKEVSGQRLWGWARRRYGSPEAFFEQFLVLNYCPLVFMEASGRNRTPDKLAPAEKKRLFRICDEALRQSIELIQPRWVVGVGVFAEKRVGLSLTGLDLTTGVITHPSPANPKANRGWAERVESQLTALG